MRIHKLLTSTIRVVGDDGVKTRTISLAKETCYLVSLDGNSITTTTASFPGNRRNVAFGSQPTAKSYDGEHLPFASIDNSTDTYWKSLNKASAGGEYLKYTLYNLYSINQVTIAPFPGQAAPASAIVQYATQDGSFLIRKLPSMGNQPRIKSLPIPTPMWTKPPTISAILRLKMIIPPRFPL